MQKFNYHTHTYRCGHATGTDEEYVEAAIKTGYTVLGFSDHAPYKTIDVSWARMNWDRLEDYLESVRELRKKYEGIIDIHLGLETEFYPEFLDEKKELHDMVEYLILGQHFIKPDSTGSFFGHNSDAEIMEYAERVCQGLDTGLFTYLAHPDVFMNHQSEFNETCQKAARMILKKAVETDTPIEINIHGVSRGKHMFPAGRQYFYPHKDFWRIAAEYPVKCLYGIDAHSPRQLMDLQALKDGEKEVGDLGLEFIEEPFI